MKTFVVICCLLATTANANVAYPPIRPLPQPPAKPIHYDYCKGCECSCQNNFRLICPKVKK